MVLQLFFDHGDLGEDGAGPPFQIHEEASQFQKYVRCVVDLLLFRSGPSAAGCCQTRRAKDKKAKRYALQVVEHLRDIMIGLTGFVDT
ncbi:unnamed protein product [Polarella glacialis]|uniref:Uncharacterized protein n=1 Tax=Polarella glacialis TaxID=89957 RepID=A0A813F2B2_POLGL|nr:unnamed protein product [Polarella glacialis]